MLSTTITRLCDGLPLAASTDDGSLSTKQKTEAKAILKRLSSSCNHPQRQSYEDGIHQYHILIQNGIIYMVFCEKAFSSNIAYSYLDDVSKEFEINHGKDVDRVERPYAFIKFDTFLQKTKKVYMGNRSIDRLKEEIHDVQQIFRSNIEEILGRGERLDTLASHSSELKSQSNKYYKQAVMVNRLAMLKTYSFLAAIILTALFTLLYLYWKLFR
eukprot:NODE_6881_length_832_cov_78.338505_g6281_i0.p1 GENE.NODE_6881_length_832_cov_78.338505_g6281_i0~~NODE_6881_length_832_cov_78.338505_g6281_i0.p1  ORF type:complete len:233 (-),score=11.45 NODE_6881_length_832_cov_78.338505_g6281_i0:132-773(-)